MKPLHAEEARPEDGGLARPSSSKRARLSYSRLSKGNNQVNPQHFEATEERLLELLNPSPALERGRQSQEGEVQDVQAEAGGVRNKSADSFGDSHSESAEEAETDSDPLVQRPSQILQRHKSLLQKDASQNRQALHT